jgi:hypothetical protein
LSDSPALPWFLSSQASSSSVRGRLGAYLLSCSWFLSRCLVLHLPPHCRRRERSIAIRSAVGAPRSSDGPSRALGTRTASAFQRRAANTTRTTGITTDVFY